METLFDDDFIRKMYKISVYISLGGPFFGYMVGMVYQLIVADEMALMKRFWTWLFFIINIVYTALSILYQVLMTPRIYRWIEKAPYGDKGEYHHRDDAR